MIQFLQLLKLEALALKMSISNQFISNVDFYSGIIYRALGIQLICSLLCLQLVDYRVGLHNGRNERK
jgi:hypothetical protein